MASLSDLAQCGDDSWNKLVLDGVTETLCRRALDLAPFTENLAYLPYDLRHQAEQAVSLLTISTGLRSNSLEQSSSPYLPPLEVLQATATRVEKGITPLPVSRIFIMTVQKFWAKLLYRV